MATNKIGSRFIQTQYASGVSQYIRLTKEVGLWKSEQSTFTKYFSSEEDILDLGCGTGRTTFALYRLGYHRIMGVDLSSPMIESARNLAKEWGMPIDFQVGDACSLPFPNEHFDHVLFSFNGIMSIPGLERRQSALNEIKRVLKPAGYFIFTTHDRDAEADYLPFWKMEKERWSRGEQNPQLYEYGDLITHSKNESRQIYIHIPDQQEVIAWLSESGFDVIESFYRSEQFREQDAVIKSSGSCRFWVVQ